MPKFNTLNDDAAVKEIKRVMIPILSESSTVKVSVIAKKLRTTKQSVMDVVESACDAELDLIVGIRCGGGIAGYKESEYEIEYINCQAEAV